MQFGYLPDGMVETEREEHPTRLSLSFDKGSTYIITTQELLTENSGLTYRIDTEDAEQQIMQINGEEVRFIYKENRIHFIWLHDAYHITGQTNLPEHEVIKILEHITFE